MLRALASPVLWFFLITGCSSPTASGSPDPGGSSTASPTAGQSSTPRPSPSASGGEPTKLPGPGPVTLPIRGSARGIGLDINLAPSSGGLYISAPAGGGSVMVALLDQGGVPRPGWPITLPAATSCGQLLPVADGSVRVVCAPDDLNQELNNGARAFAFDVTGRPLAGWPVEVAGFYVTARVIETNLQFFATRSLGDVEVEGQPSADGGLVTVSADGSVEHGIRVTQFGHCCNWEIGADGVAYGVQGPAAPPTMSLISAIDGGGVRDGWPIAIEGIASAPTFAHDGRLILTVALPRPGFGTSRVVTVDGDGNVTDRSAELLIETGVLPPTSDGAYECGVPVPRAPLNAGDGRIYVYSEIDDATYGLDATLNVLSGWPIVAGSLERPNPWLGQGDLDCPELAIPAAGPGGTVLLPLQARDPDLGGGRLASIGANGEPLSGWPVNLSRPGSELWSVVVGADGAAYALAIEPEAGGASSATVLAIAPDSTVTYATTIVDP